VLFVVDEAQHLEHKCLEVLRQLLEQYDFVAVLGGSHDLTQRLSHWQMEQWRSRVRKTLYLNGPSEPECRAIIRAELEPLLGPHGDQDCDALINAHASPGRPHDGPQVRVHLRPRSVLHHPGHLAGIRSTAPAGSTGPGAERVCSMIDTRRFRPRSSFDIDRYLEEHKDGPPLDYSEANHQAGLRLILEPEPQYRSWAVRLNDRIERWMDSVDWHKWDMRLGTVGGFAMTGFVLYMLFHIADAWLAGHFNLGAN
jgi:hypothetical protein